jgi:hypothetical protein
VPARRRRKADRPSCRSVTTRQKIGIAYGKTAHPGCYVPIPGKISSCQPHSGPDDQGSDGQDEGGARFAQWVPLGAGAPRRWSRRLHRTGSSGAGRRDRRAGAARVADARAAVGGRRRPPVVARWRRNPGAGRSRRG